MRNALWAKLEKLKEAEADFTGRKWLSLPDHSADVAAVFEAMLVSCARQILANITGTGGFPPLMLEPVDFTALYRQNLQQQAAQKAN